jgi:hypothetical protein
MTSIRSRYCFPPRAWRRASLRCKCATRQFNPCDSGFAVRSAFPTHADMTDNPLACLEALPFEGFAHDMHDQAINRN